MQINHLIVGEIQTNWYLLSSDNEIAIIDPGGEADKILSEIKKLSGNLKYIINTHYHQDHTLANKKIKQETGAKILIHESEKDYIDFRIDQALKNNDEIKIGNGTLKVIHTPGHTQGSICLFDDNYVFVGDTIFENGYGRTDLPGGSQEKMEKSLEKLVKLLKPETTIYSGHGEVFKWTKWQAWLFFKAVHMSA